MFLLLSSLYFPMTDSDDTYKRLFIIGAMLIFILNHIIQFSYDKLFVRISCISIDFILSSCFGFLFPNDSGLLFLIFFGVISTTVFLVIEKKKLLSLFSFLFIITWVLISFEKFSLTGELSFADNILSFMFVVYGAIVGSLIRNLIGARETIFNQYGQLNDSHDALREAHTQLSDYSKQVENLTVIQERNRIAREIHDTVGHNMTALLVQIQLAKELLKLDVHKSEEVISVCEKLTRNSLEEIRLSVRTLHDDEHRNVSFVPSLREMLYEFSSMSGLETTLNIEGDPILVYPTIQPTIKRVIQESLTNAKRHGFATCCIVSINITEEAVQFEIFDNGKGVKSVVPGFGLMNMKERVHEHGGEIHFESKDGEGFYIRVLIPLKQLKWSSMEVTG
jgi:signal transduction histidine kinase